MEKLVNLPLIATEGISMVLDSAMYPKKHIKKSKKIPLREVTKSKAPWAAHGWIAQCQVYFCPCGKMSLWAKLLVWKYMSPVRSFAWKSSDFHGKRLAQALVLQIETQTVEVKVYIWAKRPIRPALIKNNLTKNNLPSSRGLFTMSN